MILFVDKEVIVSLFDVIFPLSTNFYHLITENMPPFGKEIALQIFFDIEEHLYIDISRANLIKLLSTAIRKPVAQRTIPIFL
jgi:hypothetical protein